MYRINDWAEYRQARFDQPGDCHHAVLRPWREVLCEASPSFRKMYLQARYRLQVQETQRPWAVAKRKYRARRGRKRR